MENQTQITEIVELTAAETEQVEGGLFFALLAFDLAIWGYNAYQLR